MQNTASALADRQDELTATVQHLALQQAEQFVSQFPERASVLSDAELELHIKNCGWLMEDAMRRWCETGCFSYRGEADRWRLLMQEAIKARSPEYVARLERERGLA